MAIGTSCMFSRRRVAVTMISPSELFWGGRVDAEVELAVAWSGEVVAVADGGTGDAAKALSETPLSRAATA